MIVSTDNMYQMSSLLCVTGVLLVWFDLHYASMYVAFSRLSRQTPAPLFSDASAPGSAPVYATVSSPAFILSSLQLQLWLLQPLDIPSSLALGGQLA